MRRLDWLLFCCTALACSNDTFSGDGGADASDDNIIGGGDGAPDDAAKDAGKDGLVIYHRFCEDAGGVFCADFDILNDAGAGFQPPVTNDAGSITFETSNHVSSPFAMQASVSGNVSAQAQLVTLIGADAGAAIRITLDASIFVPDVGAVVAPEVDVLDIGTPWATFALSEVAGSWKLQRRGGSTSGLSTPPTPNTWNQVRLVVNLGTNGTVSLDLNGANVASLPSQDTTGIDGGLSAYPAQLQLGFYETSSPLPASETVLYDNVVVHFE